MVKTSNPTDQICATKKADVIDHVKTGALAKAFREFKRVSGVELAHKLGFASGSSIAHLEKGGRPWTSELCVRYVRGINELLAGNEKPI